MRFACLTILLFTLPLSAADRPNVLVILADDQGWGDLTINGNTNLKTPNIDSLAIDGAKFDRFYVQPVCSPTRAEFLTGRYHPRGGVRNVSMGGERLNLSEHTIADAFKNSGYNTGCFGKWHNGSQYPYHPNGRGFNEYFGFTSGHWGEYFNAALDHNGIPIKGEGFLPDELSKRAGKFMQQSQAQHKPFFCFVTFNTPHSPMQVPDVYWNRFQNKLLEKRGEGKEDLNHTRAALAMMENLDDNVGKLLAFLKETQQDQNTIVLYFSDNGPNGARWNGGMKGIKGSTDEGGVRSPLHIRWPNKIARGTEIKPIVAAIDLLPTLLDCCEVARPANAEPLDGFSLKTVLMTPNASVKDRVLFQHWSGRTSARTQQYRLDASGALFDMVNDPFQKKDIAKDKPEIKQELTKAVSKWRAAVLPGIQGNDDRPYPVGHLIQNLAVLPARDGLMLGGIKRSANAPNCSFFTNWTKPEDAMTWNVEILTPGSYELVLQYTCAEANLGSTIHASVNSATWTGKVTIAHDPPLRGMAEDRVLRKGESYVKDFKSLSLGITELPKGRAVLKLSATGIPGNAVADIRSVELKRIVAK